ncbi:MAG: TlpA family protein disulfide reductase [Acidobacteria bacterium]|nr:TlpA family protein disulfide reductase [Acidobacteriota bacterium]
MKRAVQFTIFAMFAVFSAVAVSGQTVLSTTDNRRFDLEDHRGKVVVVAIGAAWLPLSTKQAEFTNALAKKYSGRDVVFYFVVTDSTNSRSRNFADNAAIDRFTADKKLTMPVLRDSDGTATMRRFKVDQIPSFVILDKQGQPAVEPFGGLDPKFDLTGPISRAIDRLL